MIQACDLPPGGLAVAHDNIKSWAVSGPKRENQQSLWRDDEFTLTCDQSGTVHEVSISLPVRFGVIERPPLIVCLDGPWIAGTVRDATRIMSMSREAPEAVVVGVGFSCDSMAEYLRERARWFTPTPYVPPPETGVKGLVADECGKASILTDFVRDQLLPNLDERLAAEGQESVGDRWFVGHSFSALFGLRALLTEPDLFDRWLLASPSIWWDGRSILRTEQAWADGNADLAARVFMSAGEAEDRSGLTHPFDMGKNVRALAETLRAREYPSLALENVTLAGDDHSSTIGAAVSKGLRSLFA